MKANGVISVAIFTLFWTALVGVADGIVGRNLFRALRALDYSETTGIVLSSEVTHQYGSKGGNYGVAIRYRYEVNGTEREGDRYRHSGFSSSSDSSWADAVVGQHPVGASVKVYYDPANPEESVLSRGINGSDLFILLFLTPFNLIMLALWVAPVGALFHRIRPPVAGGVKWWTDGRTTRVRLPPYSPIVAGLGGVGGTAFASIFILGFGFGGSPSLAVGHVTWMMVIGVGVSVAGWQWLQQRAGKADLVLDDLERTAELPATFGRKQRRTVPWSEITGVVLERIEQRSRKGGTSYNYVVQLKRGNQADKLDEWHDQQHAESFAA